MELGNMMFGHSRGEHPIPRDADFETPLFALFRAANIDSYGWAKDARQYGVGIGFENESFIVRPYYWGDCTCGAEQREEAWEASDPGHAPECVHEQIGHIQERHQKRSWNPRDPKFRAYNAEIDAVLAKFGLPKEGYLCHCTCGRAERWRAFWDVNGHKDDCSLVLPNFQHKPTGFLVQWYKYPLRDSYMSENLSAEQWRAIMLDCVRSLRRRKSIAT